MNFKCQNPYCQIIYKSSYKHSKFCSKECKKDYNKELDNEQSLTIKKANLLKRFPYCSSCGCDNIYVLEVDHILPRYLGGSDDYENLRVLCANCHSERHRNKTLKND